MNNPAANRQPCCTPIKHSDGSPQSAENITQRRSQPFNAVDIPGGDALHGTDSPFLPLDEESPCRTKEIKPFQIMRTTVTNAMFAEFVEATGYKTDAEKLGWSFVFLNQLPPNFKATRAVAQTQWWRQVEGACWHAISGPDAPTELQAEHPVVHVSWNDATAFATWAGGRLPSEAEWEHAARGGSGDILFPWGNQEPNDFSYLPCNIWQGDFPSNNTAADGFAATAPAESFEPNNFGLFNMCGNVWEWTSGRMKITGRSKESRQHAKHYKGCKLLKGGSFLCHKSYCFRYRIAARTGNTPDTSTTHQGFRLVFD
jgi:formylglycine-generating enzyme required for sulfatase activity